MTQPQIERRVYQKDDPELFEKIENLVFASQLEAEVDGVQYRIARGDDDAAGHYYRLLPHGLAQGGQAATDRDGINGFSEQKVAVGDVVVDDEPEELREEDVTNDPECEPLEPDEPA